MKLSTDHSNKICRGAFTLTLLTSLVGGHLTGFMILHDEVSNLYDLFWKITAGLFFLNFFYFIICITALTIQTANKSDIMKAGAFMLINIPFYICCTVLLILWLNF